MSLKNLLNEGKIESVEKAEFSCDSSLKDISSAKNSLNSKDYDWAIAISYTAILKVVRSFMQSKGFRPIGKEHHKNAFEFVRDSGFNLQLVDYFDKIRKYRNSFMYGITEGNTEKNAKETILNAERFVLEIRTFVLQNRTGES